MATVPGLVHSICGLPYRSSSSSPSSFPSFFTFSSTSLVSPTSPSGGGKCFGVQRDRRRSQALVCRAMVQQTVHGASAAYAKEMERLAAKESLLLAFKDSGGFEASVNGKTTPMERVDVNERIIGLERVNPTPRPTTSPFLEGRWKFEWFGSGSPGLFAARNIFERIPSTLANLSKMDAVIKDGYAKITANMKILNSIESKFTISSKLSVEGPLRMKEEYVEGILESPTVIEESLPEQLRGVFTQAVNAMQQLPVPITDAMANGLTIPLNKTTESWR
ncbi:probable plastid-lipid-associated protein 13, chloroplastic isoform X2 [Malania oleifera]|uniref:probable plastid-lipid-associated protein 13, chloroplastic isoform X2 n=1 Tax=Malania oleifera TaxID=397392 RepID=UPI0025ADB962|nr:probable plastid-lipid-associated protein 13, chloroplastic isoform X2 [Malania oleifera]